MAARRIAVQVLACLILEIGPTAALARELTEAEIRGWIDRIVALQRRRRASPDDPSLLLQLAEAYGRIGDLPRARSAARRAGRSGANPTAVRLVDADVLHRWGHDQEAIPIYLQILEQSPTQTHALAQLWRIAVEQIVSGRPTTPELADAIARLQATGAYVPDVFHPDPEAAMEAVRLSREAQDLLERRRASDAITRAQQAISQDPGLAPAFEVLWRAYSLIGEADRALGASTIYLEIDPDGAAAAEAREAVRKYFRDLLLH
ncbi:MAG: hypothetical protein HYY06_16695 [Deltaproteobacteria bacterium]|nr:hypothetical protein [Deltaproteobacteria bacterium]